MGRFFDELTTQASLSRAWRQIKSNGRASRSHETREAIEHFNQSADQNIRTLQKLLRDKERPFEFDPQKGVLKRKTGGGNRGIVMASVRNRIVERALLEILQNKSDYVRCVIEQPTSIGGVPDRSVPHGLALIDQAFKAGKKFFVRSDISGFFDHVPRGEVLGRIRSHIPDEPFNSLLSKATTVVLQNEAMLGEDRKAFPEGEEGVAQGSPLSPLFGNILLNEFDREFNRDGILCVRFIDDFVILAPSSSKAEKAFLSARRHLEALGLRCHDPFETRTRREKADAGNVDGGFIFLGYDIRPGLLQPSASARSSILSKIDDHFRCGRKSIKKVITRGSSVGVRQRYAQTLDVVDRALHGWGEAFSYANGLDAIEGVDRAVDEKLIKFRSWYREQIRTADWKCRRRTGGVCLASDIARKSLEDLPQRISPGKTFNGAKLAVHISTDGSVISSKAGEQGPGGWAFINHETGAEVGGWEIQTTNNRMELRAVIEALKSVPEARPIRIFTDSQYVHSVANRNAVVRKNADLWSEFEALIKVRRAKIIWVKGHNGDTHNERADALAGVQAELARQNVCIRAA